MKIREIKSQNRRDFVAVYECEHCGHTIEGYGYDDTNFHVNVIPKMKCKNCQQISKATYRPLSTKYPDSMTI